MHALTIPRALTAAAVIAALGLGLWLTARSPRDSSSEPSSSPLVVAGDEAPADPPQQPHSAESHETPAAAKLRELTAMSETFRNTTFLIAIRDSGFVCNELLGVYGGVNDATTWTATCSEMLAYTVGVHGTGALLIEPMLQHLDAVPRVPTRVPDTDRVVPLPPQRLPPQR